MPLNQIASVLSDPGLIGGIERNLEQKLLRPVLEGIGWDPLVQLHWGVQIRMDDTIREVDLLLADPARLYCVVEAKAWHRELGLQETTQTQRYCERLEAPFGLLTNGRQWRAWDPLRGWHDTLNIDDVRRDAEALLAALGEICGPAILPGRTWDVLPDDARSLGITPGTPPGVLDASQAVMDATRNLEAAINAQGVLIPEPTERGWKATLRGETVFGVHGAPRTPLGWSLWIGWEALRACGMAEGDERRIRDAKVEYENDPTSDAAAKRFVETILDVVA
jgi:hypothetical protein